MVALVHCFWLWTRVRSFLRPVALPLALGGHVIGFEGPPGVLDSSINSEFLAQLTRLAATGDRYSIPVLGDGYSTPVLK